MDEKLKHRLVGLAVIISLGAIFAPAMMRKSSQKLEGHFSVNIKLPPKPVAPEVVTTDEEQLFKTIKVARVAIPGVPAEKQLPQLVQAEPLDVNEKISANAVAVAKNQVIANEPIQLALSDSLSHDNKTPVERPIKKQKNNIESKVIVAAALKSRQLAAKKPNRVLRPVIKSQVYAVQLASFSQINNAQSLVSRLKNKGYKATFTQIKGKNGPIYKVYVGHSPSKVEVLRLKNQLASSMQLNGFVVNTGVS